MSEFVIDNRPILIDELADLCEYWKKHRDKNRTPRAVEQAVVSLCLEIVEDIKLMEQK